MKVSVLLLTLNEAINLPRCLDALSWCDDIAIVDEANKVKLPETKPPEPEPVAAKEHEDAEEKKEQEEEMQ